MSSFLGNSLTRGSNLKMLSWSKEATNNFWFLLFIIKEHGSERQKYLLEVKGTRWRKEFQMVQPSEQRLATATVQQRQPKKIMAECENKGLTKKRL